jgi:hypothetical protein
MNSFIGFGDYIAFGPTWEDQVQRYVLPRPIGRTCVTIDDSGACCVVGG